MILGSLDVVITPKVLALKFVAGSPGRRLLVTLKASARTSSLWVSRSWKARERAISNCQVPGPCILLGPMFPYRPLAGCVNARGFKSFVSGDCAAEGPAR